MTRKIAVLGAGAWGTALCFPLCQNSADVWLWGRSASEIERYRLTRENHRYLPGVTLPGNLHLSSEIDRVLENAAVIVLAVPTHSFRSVLAAARAMISPETILVSAAKGIEPDTQLRMTEVISQECPGHSLARIACISGPNFAIEVASHQPSATVAGALEASVGEELQDVLMTSDLRVYTNPDIAGVELGGSLKNIIALGVGIAEGMGLGYNARAALITRGLAEMARLGLALGANPLTFAGLSGMGDLVVTCTGEHSRNRRCGMALGMGETLDSFFARTGLTVEGVRTTQAAHRMAATLGIDLPVTEQIYEVLFNGKDPKMAVTSLMTRGKKHEIEEVAQYR